MPQLTLKDANDLQKLVGFKIEGLAVIVGPDCTLQLRLSHPAAEKQVLLSVIASVSFGRSGNVMTSNGTLTFKSEDIDEEPSSVPRA